MKYFSYQKHEDCEIIAKTKAGTNNFLEVLFIFLSNYYALLVITIKNP